MVIVSLSPALSPNPLFFMNSKKAGGGLGTRLSLSMSFIVLHKAIFIESLYCGWLVHVEEEGSILATR